MNRKGFTLIELLIVVVIISILAAIAIPRFENSKSKAVLASMKSDLRNLATAQESFWFINSDYAGNFGAVEVNAVGGAGVVEFAQTQGSTLTMNWLGASGWNATITNPQALNPTTCGIFVGPPGNSPNAAVTTEGVPDCW